MASVVVNEGNAKSFVVATAVAANTAVKLDSNKKVVPATAGTDVIIGVVNVAAAVGAAVDVQLRSKAGTYKAVASAAISRGAAVTATTGGKLVTTTTANDQIIGYALDVASADGDVIELLPSTGKY